MDEQLTKPLVSLAVSLVVIAALLFIPAGTLASAAGWWFMATFLAAIGITLPILWRVNPEIFAARAGFKPGTKGWDLALAPVQFLALIAVLVLAALDYRFGWSDMPLALMLAGYPTFLAGFAGMAWAQAVNRFFEPGVRIQTDRGHVVIDNGPYAQIRHPGYVGASLLSVGIALALGSYWALLPAVLVIAILVYRTLREEQTLIAELPGYADYAKRVRYRWIPGIW